MSDSRERFEAWAKVPPREFDTAIHTGKGAWPGQYSDYTVQCAWEAWQAAERETARRCAEIFELACNNFVTKRNIQREFPGAFKQANLTEPKTSL